MCAIIAYQSGECKEFSTSSDGKQYGGEPVGVTGWGKGWEFKELARRLKENKNRLRYINR